MRSVYNVFMHDTLFTFLYHVFYVCAWFFCKCGGQKILMARRRFLCVFVGFHARGPSVKTDICCVNDLNTFFSCSREWLFCSWLNFNFNAFELHKFWCDFVFLTLDSCLVISDDFCEIETFVSRVFRWFRVHRAHLYLDLAKTKTHILCLFDANFHHYCHHPVHSSCANFEEINAEKNDLIVYTNT